LGLNLGCDLLYAISGFGGALFVTWLSGLALIGFSLRDPHAAAPPPVCEKSDWRSVAFLLYVFGLLYFVSIHAIPHQINADEMTIMAHERNEVANRPYDFFGLSDYFQFPKFIFFALGMFAEGMGGINLAHARMAHATLGLAIVLLSYFLFRVHWPKTNALAAAVVLGVNHSFLAISRMGMRDNSGLFFELPGFILLSLGLKRKSASLGFTGGAMLGLTYYGYFPGRIAVFVWATFMILLLLFFRKSFPFRDWLKFGTASALGFVLCVMPVMVATVQTEESVRFARETMLLFPEGREIQRSWVDSDRINDAYKINIVNGLTAFNNSIVDQGWVYPNYGHGFGDPVTGALVWLGVAGVIFQFVKKRAEPFALFMAGGLVFLLLVFSFFVNKAPHYARLLVILPFFAFCVVHGATMAIDVAARKLRFVTRARALPVVVAIIVAVNLAIVSDFFRKGLNEKDLYVEESLGSIGRYVEARKNLSDYSFFVASSEEFPFFTHGPDWRWKQWLMFFSRKSEEAIVLKPGEYELLPERGFMLFLSSEAWAATGKAITERYKTFTMHHITPDDLYMVFEVP
jgi:4-amino-4-deoxy-L-arabinose transferase-like glycosyltransferase